MSSSNDDDGFEFGFGTFLLVLLFILMKNIPHACASGCDGSSSAPKNRKKKKFDYNNGKCLHELDVVVLESAIEWNPRRLFLRCALWEKVELRCDYFIWADEVVDAGRDCGIQEQSEESKWRSAEESNWKVEEEIKKLLQTIDGINQKLKSIENGCRPLLAPRPPFALGLLAFGPLILGASGKGLGPLMGCRVRPGVDINCWNLSLKEGLVVFIISELTTG
ncbi:hypothetical protein S245_029049 [Arachis hypogaea]